ncbi:hypothetical protein OV450_3716 [Actinobacteria bacterium OV450]|nr:hypothetical protein OV450_3716 [Actinobacteria bacterium OV450]
MDPYEELLAKERDMARELTARGVRPRPYGGDDGTAVEGWQVKELASFHRDEYRGPGDWDDFRSTSVLLLAADGRFFTHAESWSDEPDRRTGRAVQEHRRELRPASAALLVGLGPGRPFAALSAMLERLPWTAYSYAPAPGPPQAVPAPARPAPAPQPAPASRAPRNAGGFFYGCVVGGIGAAVLGIVLGMAGVVGGDALGITTMAFALASVVACMAIGAVRGGRTPAPPRRTGRPGARR